MKRLTVLVLAFLTFSLFCFSQETAVKGSMSGVVTDSTGAVVPDAKVSVEGSTGKRVVSTGPEGLFFVSPLTPGTYSVTVEKQGFRTTQAKNIEVFTGKTSSVSISLRPGLVSEMVEVSATAVAVDTASSAVSTNLNDTFYSSVPMGRGVPSIFYASVGVNSGGGTGMANPSISGGSGLENQYVADGVNITDGAMGGIGVFSQSYGALTPGINLSFVKEVQVKTGGYEPQYGKSTGGLVQIVTKSGSNTYHGGVSAFFGPQQFEAERLNSDSFNRLNQQGPLNHLGAYDIAAEIGGYAPGLKDRMFFFGSFNPSWTTQYSQLANLHGVFTYPLIGKAEDLKATSYNYAAKLTFKLSDKHQVESSIFGDPTRTNTSAFNTTTTFSDSTFSKLSYGTRNWAARYNGTLSPTWLLNASFSWGHNYFTETPLNSQINRITDMTGCGYTGTTGSTSCVTPLTPGTLNGPLGPMSGIYNRQGVGFTVSPTEGDNYALNFDTQKVVNKFGTHNFSIGYHYERNFYKGMRDYLGQLFTITPDMADSMGAPGLVGAQSSASFELRTSSNTAYPTMFIPGAGIQHVYLRQTRGIMDNTGFDTNGTYHAAYINDSWTINKHVTVNIGWRWEQQRMQGTPYTDFRSGQLFHTHYTFTDNWSPRIGLSIDPKGDRKTKVYGNFARYSYAIPLDMAIRSLSNELDFPTTAWAPVADAANNVVINSDGTLANPILNDAHYHGALTGASLSSTTSIAPGTKMQYIQEWVAGVQHEFPKGLMVDFRWIDRRMKRAVEDVSGISPEAYQAADADGNYYVNQVYLITNPTPNTDLFINPIEQKLTVGAAAAANAANPTGPCSIFADPVTDASGNALGSVCIPNAYADPGTFSQPIAGSLGHDGIPDGFVNPIRIYKAIEFEINKSFSRGWQLRANYRWAQLSGNYEGAYRNDNGQADPSISSLFDFTQGEFGLLGDQFSVGWLNTDRRHILNTFVSYTFSTGVLKNLTLGTAVRVESGIPVNDLRAHPAYQNAGEVPVGGRGSLGRTPSDGQADVHAEYLLKLNEKHALHFGADLFNITNQKTKLRVDQNQDRSYLVANADFLKPSQGTGLNPALAFQRPFYGRLFVRWTF